MDWRWFVPLGFIAAVVLVLLANLPASAQQMYRPSDRPVEQWRGVVAVCIQGEPGAQAQCDTGQTRETRPTREACMAYTLDQLRELTRLIQTDFPLAQVAARYDCVRELDQYDA